jgi:hypothetical protein
LIASVVLGCTAGCDLAALSEDDATAIVKDMREDPIFSPPPGVRVVETVESPCGSGSVPPYVEQIVTRDAGGPSIGSLYEARLRELGWQPVRRAAGDSIAAEKGDRLFSIASRADNEWSVFLQHGDEIAACS